MSATGDFSRRYPDDAGVTLIEALIVVAITAMVALIAFPRMQQMLLLMSQRLTVAGVAARLREARAGALERDEPVAFAVSSGGHSYGVPTLSRGVDHASPGVIVRVAGDDRGRIVFQGDGTSVGGLIQVTAMGRTIGVRVEPMSGAVAITP